MLLNIQALRAIAALLVVLVHSKGMLQTAGVDAGALGFGIAGVDLFFVISGFIMVYMTSGRETTPGKFAINRVVRIVPLYWLVTFAVFAVALVAPALVKATRPDIVELLKSMFFIPYVKSNGMTQPVAFVGWTLNYEMFFYALFAVGLTLGRKGVPAVIAVIAGLVALHPWATSPIASFYTNPILLEFATGMVIGRAYPYLRGSYGLPLLLIGFGFIFAAPSLWPDAHRAWIFGAPSILVVVGALMLERNGRSTSRLQLLGDASYSIYLTHFFVTQAAKKLFSFVEPSVPMAILFMLAAFVGAAIVGVLVHLWVERPATEAVRRLLKRRPAPLVPAAW
jgi:exopolysaccharide production protein ExoZ